MSDGHERDEPGASAATGLHDGPDDLLAGRDEADLAGAEALAALHMVGEIVGEIGDALLLDASDLAAAEGLDRLEASVPLPIGDLRLLESAPLGDWFALLGDDLALDLDLDGLDPDATPTHAALRAGRDPRSALGAFLAAAREVAATQGDDVSARVRLSVAKGLARAEAASLLAARAEDAAAHELAARTTVAAFYFAAAFDRLVALREVSFWEEHGLAHEGGRAFVVVCDAPGYLAGPALDVVGASSSRVPAWLPLSRATSRQFEERARATRDLRAEDGVWPDPPRVLTPAHLHVVPRAPGLEATLARLHAMQRDLALAYLATRVEGNTAGGRPVRVRFAGERPAGCVLGSTAGMSTPLARGTATGTFTSDGEAPGEGAEAGGGSALAHLATWAFDAGSPDKLLIARECLARELPPGAIVPLPEVEAAAARALDAAKANFTLFLRRGTERYFALREAAQDAVADYAETVRKAVGDLTSDVVENVYRTVALIVGVVIAALLQNEAGGTVARLATILYVLYLVFVLFFVIRARWDRYHLEGGALDDRLAAMDELTTAERERLRAPARAAEAHFERYMRATLYVYGILLGLAFVWAFIVFTPLGGGLEFLKSK